MLDSKIEPELPLFFGLPLFDIFLKGQYVNMVSWLQLIYPGGVTKLSEIDQITPILDHSKIKSMTIKTNITPNLLNSDYFLYSLIFAF